MKEVIEHEGETHHTMNSPTTPHTSALSPTSEYYPDIAGLYKATSSDFSSSSIDEEVEDKGGNNQTTNSPTTPHTNDFSPTSDCYPDIAGLYLVSSSSASSSSSNVDESGDVHSLSGMTVVADSNVEKYKKQIADFAARALPSRRLSTTLPSSQLESTVPAQTFLGKVPNGRSSNEEAPIPQGAAFPEHISSGKTEGPDESPKRGQKLLVEGLLCQVNAASAKAGSSASQTLAPITAPTVVLSEDRLSLSVSMTESRTINTPERSPGIKDRIVSIKDSASEALANFGNNVVLRLGQGGSIFNDLLDVIHQVLRVYVSFYLKWFLIIGGALFFADLGGFLTYLVACNSPPVRAMFGLAPMVPWVGAHLPTHASTCPPGNTVSIKIVCKTFHLDPEEFHFCIPTSQPKPVRDHPIKLDPLGPSFQQNTGRLINCAHFAFDASPTWLQAIEWRSSLHEFHIALLRSRDEYPFVRQAAEYVRQTGELANDIAMPLSDYESYMGTFMSLHGTATRHASWQLDTLRGQISSWSGLANLFLPRFEMSISILRTLGRWTPLSQTSIDWLGPKLSSGPKLLTMHAQSSVPCIIRDYIDTMQPALDAAMEETQKIRANLADQNKHMGLAAEHLDTGKHHESKALVEQGKQSWYKRVFSSEWKSRLQLQNLETLEQYAEHAGFLLEGIQAVQDSLLGVSSDLKNIKNVVKWLEWKVENGERIIDTKMIASWIETTSKSVEALEKKKHQLAMQTHQRYIEKYGMEGKSYEERHHSSRPDGPSAKRAKGRIRDWGRKLFVRSWLFPQVLGESCVLRHRGGILFRMESAGAFRFKLHIIHRVTTHHCI